MSLTGGNLGDEKKRVRNYGDGVKHAVVDYTSVKTDSERWVEISECQ